MNLQRCGYEMGSGVGNCPILGILDITVKSSHKKDHIPILVG